MIKTQLAFYVGCHAQRSISRALFSENGAFCISACANEMEREVSGSACQKKGKEMCWTSNEAGSEIFM